MIGAQVVNFHFILGFCMLFLPPRFFGRNRAESKTEATQLTLANQRRLIEKLINIILTDYESSNNFSCSLGFHGFMPGGSVPHGYGDIAIRGWHHSITHRGKKLGKRFHKHDKTWKKDGRMIYCRIDIVCMICCRTEYLLPNSTKIFIDVLVFFL